MKRKIVSLLLCASMVSSMLIGCTGSTETEKKENTETTKESEETTEEDNTVVPEKKDVESATAEEVQAFMSDSDENTVLVDARTQEAYSGWALEGATHGGHLKNSALFSARWLDCEYAGETPRESFLQKAIKEQNITEDSDVIVYDYTGEQAVSVANYFQEQGIENVSVFQANEIIDAGTDLESYTNYDRFLPSEIVKNISDVKTGKEENLSEEAKAIVGENLDKVILVDVGFGNIKESTYFSVGHVPGAIHINTDCYERPRVYVPEKRAAYAKEWRLISVEEFRDSVCPQYGITKDSIVILTGAAAQPYGRLAFMLRSLGVKVYGMSGLLTAWKYNGYELDTAEDTLVIPEAVSSFGSDTIENPDEIVWTDDVKAILSGEVDAQLIDNRTEEEWNGEYSGYGYHDIAGRIDGSIWCDGGNYGLGEYFQNVDNTPRTQEELLNYMESNGVDTSKPMVFFCGDSWGAAMIAYWCQAVDINDVKEWGNGLTSWVNEGNEIIDHNGTKIHYDKTRDTVVDQDGNDVSDGINFLADETAEE